MRLAEQLEFLYSSGETRRFHTWPVLRERTIAHHSWHVTMLLYLLYGQEEPGVSMILLMAGLAHDAAEWKFGDIPSPAKRSVGAMIPDFRAKWGEMEEAELSKVGLDFDKYLSDEERRRLKFCDSLEGAFYCANERAMGNALIRPAFYNFRKYLGEVHDPSNTNEVEALACLDDTWRSWHAR